MPKTDVIHPTLVSNNNNNNINDSTTEMLWCEPPEKLENILQYQSTHTNDLPLISIAQINSKQNLTINTSEQTLTTNNALNFTLFDWMNATTIASNESNVNITDTINTTSSERPEKVYHPHGTEIIFKCIPNGDGVRNTWKITCEYGGWIGRAAKCGIYKINVKF